MNISSMFDQSPADLDKMRRRMEIRQRLKHEYNRMIHNPLAPSYNVHMSSPQLERYQAAKSYRKDFLRYRWYHYIPLFGFMVSLAFWGQIQRNITVDKKVSEKFEPPEWLYGRQAQRPVFIRTFYTTYFPLDQGC